MVKNTGENPSGSDNPKEKPTKQEGNKDKYAHIAEGRRASIAAVMNGAKSKWDGIKGKISKGKDWLMSKIGGPMDTAIDVAVTLPERAVDASKYVGEKAHEKYKLLKAKGEKVYENLAKRVEEAKKKRDEKMAQRKIETQIREVGRLKAEGERLEAERKVNINKTIEAEEKLAEMIACQKRKKEINSTRQKFKEPTGDEGQNDEMHGEASAEERIREDSERFSLAFAALDKIYAKEDTGDVKKAEELLKETQGENLEKKLDDADEEEGVSEIEGGEALKLSYEEFIEQEVEVKRKALDKRSDLSEEEKDRILEKTEIYADKYYVYNKTRGNHPSKKSKKDYYAILEEVEKYAKN